VLEVMTISSDHEYFKSLIGNLISRLAEEHDIPIASFGSTTFRKKALERGLEPDECYYVANERRVRGKRRLDLRRDPPPDLIVEIDVSYRHVDREAIYAAMGVPEMWRFDGKRLRAFRLVDGGWRAIAAVGRGASSRSDQPDVLRGVAISITHRPTFFSPQQPTL
jgi:Uma2 family endonuclease